MNTRYMTTVCAAAALAILTSPSTWAQAPAAPLSAVLQFLSESKEDAVRLDVLRGVKAGLSGRRSVPMPKEWPSWARTRQEHHPGNPPAVSESWPDLRKPVRPEYAAWNP